jgi:hypothetical protein
MSTSPTYVLVMFAFVGMATVLGAPNAMAATTGLQFVPVTPCRVVDTRNPTGAFGGPQLAAGAIREFDIPNGACGIPANAAAYSLNVTVVPEKFLGYLTIWPTGQTQPLVSTLNSDGRVKATAAITPAGTNGGVSIYVTDLTHVILDINGYFVPAGTPSSLAFYTIPPCRVADTRNATGTFGGPSLAGGSNRAFPIWSGSCNIPSSAQAYSLNVTAVPHSELGYLTIWPTLTPKPLVSTLNSNTGVVTANAAIVPVGVDGQVSIFVTDDADVVLDVNGYFAPPSSSGMSLFTTMPCRILDTRLTTGAFDGVLPVEVATSPCSLPSAAQAYVFNATVVPSGPLGYLTLWPDAQAQPPVSTLNAQDGVDTSNMAIVPSNNGRVDVFSSSFTQLILDAATYFAGVKPSTTYLPLALGNKWTFSDGSYLQDFGPLTEVCCGSGPGGWIPFPVNPEDLAYFDKTGKYVFDMIFVNQLVPASAQTSYTGDPAIWLVGFSNAGPIQATGLPPVLTGVNSDFSIPGLAWVVNDSPQTGQNFFDGFSGQYATSTIVAVNGTQPYGANQQINGVAQISLAAPALAPASQQALSIYATAKYSLAPGIGFTSFPGPNGTTLTLTSYSINQVQ